MSAGDLLSKSLNESRVIVLAGAGTSMVAPTSLPSWRDVNRAVLNALVAGAAPVLDDARALADRILERQQSNLLPSEYFAEIIVGAVGASYFPVLKCLDSRTPNAVHRSLARLAAQGRLRAVLTTNFDRAIESAFEEEGVALDVRFREAEMRALADDLHLFDADRTCRLIKVHGCASEPDTLVDTLSQRKRGLPSAVLAIVRHLLDRNHLLVLGFSGADLEADPGYLGLRAAAERGVGLTWLIRKATEPLGAVKELKDVWGPRAQIVKGELPQWLEERVGVSSATSEGGRSTVDEARVRADAATARELVAPIANRWAAELGADRSGLVLAFLLEAAGEEVVAMDVMSRLEAAWPTDAQSGPLLEEHLLLLAHLAQQLAARGQVNEAAGALDEAARRAQLLADRRLAAQIAKQRGNLLRQMGQFANAETVFRDALKLASPVERPSVLGDLAPVLALLGRDEEAREALRAAIDGFTRLGDEVHRAGELVNLAALSAPEEAKRLRTEAMAVFDRLGHETGCVTLLLNEAKAARDTGDAKSAREHYEQAHRVAARKGNRRLNAMALHGLAVAQDEAGDADAARANYAAALQEAEAARHTMEVASILNNLGRFHRDRKEWGAAAEARRRALEIYRSAGHVRGEADTLHAAGLDAIERGDPAAAIEPTRKAAVLFDRLGDIHRRVQTSTNLAVALRDAGHPQEASEVYRSLLALSRDPRWAPLVPGWLVGVGRCELQLEQTDAARRDLLEGIELTADVSGLPAAAALTKMIVQDTGDDDSGRSVADAVVLALSQRIGGASQQARGLAEAGRTKDAIKLLLSAAAAAEHAGMTKLLAASWTNAGRVFEMAGETQAALAAFARGSRVADEAEDFGTARIAINGAIRLLAQSDETDKLASALEDLAFIEEAEGNGLAAAEARAQAASALLTPFGRKDGVTTREAAHQRAGRAEALLKAALPALESGASELLERARYDKDFVDRVRSA